MANMMQSTPKPSLWFIRLLGVLQLRYFHIHQQDAHQKLRMHRNGGKFSHWSLSMPAAHLQYPDAMAGTG